MCSSIMGCNSLNFLLLLAKVSTLPGNRVTLSMMLVKWLVSLLKQADGKPPFFTPPFVEVRAWTMEAINVVVHRRQLCAES